MVIAIILYRSDYAMKVAVTIWNGRVSPVFDTASRFLVIELDGMHEVSRGEHIFPELSAPLKIRVLRELEVGMLICGAVSNPIAALLDSSGIQLIPWVSGEVGEVIDAFKRGSLTDTGYLMPGCRGRRRRCQRGRRGRGGRTRSME
jgi:predicted Fe-Mo cluster-binding NifX family protein